MLALLAAALVTLGAAPRTVSPPAPFAWPTPDLLEDAEVEGPMSAEGVPIRLRAVKLKHSIDELAPLYFDAYRKAGFYIPPREHQLDLFRDPALTALDPRHLVSYTAIFQRNADGTTTVILGEANLALSHPAQVPPGFPVYAGAEHLSSIHLESAELISYSARAEPKAVRQFYAGALARLGFAPGQSPEDVNVFRKGDTQLELSLGSRDGATSVVVVLRHPQPAPAAPAGTTAGH